MVAKSLSEIWTPVPFYPKQLIHTRQKKDSANFYMCRGVVNRTQGMDSVLGEVSKRNGEHVPFSSQTYIPELEVSYTLSSHR